MQDQRRLTRSTDLNAAPKKSTPKAPAPAMQIGNTPLFVWPVLEGRYGAIRAHVKDESVNLGGTVKVRARKALLDHLESTHTWSKGGLPRLEEPVVEFLAPDDPLRDAKVVPYVPTQLPPLKSEPIEIGLVQITNGNSGMILGQLAQDRSSDKIRFRVINLVSTKMPESIKGKLRRYSEVVEVDLRSENLGPTEQLLLAQKRTGVQFNNIHHVETTILPEGYPRIITEIAQANVKPNYVFCPGGGGELAYALARAIESRWIETPPVLVVCVPKGHVLAQQDIVFQKHMPTTDADKLETPFALYSTKLQKLRDEGKVQVLEVDKRELEIEFAFLGKLGIRAERSAAIAFAGAKKFQFKPTDVVVIVNTGKGECIETTKERILRKARNAVTTLLKYVGIPLLALSLAGGGASAYVGQQQRIYTSLLNEAVDFADTDGNHVLSVAESQAACRELPDRTAASCINAYYWVGFSPRDVEFYVRAMRQRVTPDMIARLISAQLYRDYRAGTFRCEELNPQFCNRPEPPNHELQQFRYGVRDFLQNRFGIDVYESKWLSWLR